MHAMQCPACGYLPTTTKGDLDCCPACGTPQKAIKRVAPLAYAAMFSAVPILLMPFLFPIPLTLGWLALRQIHRTPHYSGTGRAVFALIWSALGGLLSALVGLVVLNSR